MSEPRCICGGPWPCPDIDAPNYRSEAYSPHGRAASERPPVDPLREELHAAVDAVRDKLAAEGKPANPRWARMVKDNIDIALASPVDPQCTCAAEYVVCPVHPKAPWGPGRPPVDPQPMTEAVAVVVHRWRHPSYRMGEQGCRCRDDATMAVDVALSEGLVASPAAPGWPRCQDGYDLRTEVCPVCSPAVPPEGLDVERLAQVLHSQPHHYRGGADDDLARMACTQMSGPSKCERKAASIAREYQRLSDTGDTPKEPT